MRLTTLKPIGVVTERVANANNVSWLSENRYASPIGNKAPTTLAMTTIMISRLTGNPLKSIAVNSSASNTVT